MSSKPQVWDLEVDFVSVGSGLGGLCSAIVAHDNGDKVVVLEKAPKLGGICAYSGGEVFVPNNYVQQRDGIPDSREEGFKYFDFLAAGYADPELMNQLLDVGPVALQYFGEKAGIKWKVIKNFPDYHYPKAPGTVATGRYLECELFHGAELGEWQKKTYLSPHMPQGIIHDEMFGMGGFPQIMQWDFRLMGKRIAGDYRGFGPAMMGNFIKSAMIDRKIPAFVNAPVQELISEGGRVIGVRAEKEGKPFYVKANKGVILAVGGYDWKPEIAKYFEQLPEWNSMCMPSIEGDGMVLGGEVGAALAGVPPANLGLFFGYNIPGEEFEGKPLWRGSWEGGFPHAIWVNKAGKRFADEAFYKDYLPKTKEWDGVKQEQPNFPPYFIFDQNYRDKYPLGTFLPVQDIPEDMVVKADTLRELGEKLGIDGAALEATVAHFNVGAEEGVDPDFDRGTYPWAHMMTGDRSRKNPNLGPLNKAPYYGMRLKVCSVGINAVGLKTNKDYQVMHVRGHAIPGLYAAGNAAAPLDSGAGYNSGISNLRGMVGGYLAALHATKSLVTR